MKWSALGTGVNNAVVFGQRIVLTYLLVKSDFGLASMVAVVTEFCRAFADLGIGNAIIFRQDSTRDQLSSLYWLNFFAGFLVFGLIWALRFTIADFFGEPELAGIVSLAAVSFLIAPLGLQFQVLMQRDLQFRALTIIDIISVLGSAAVAISCAFAGLGVYSLIFGYVSNMAIRSVILFVVGIRRWAPAFHFRMSDLKGYLSFGIFQVGQASLGKLANNMDLVMIGKFMGVEALGLYSLAYHLVLAPLQRVVPILRRVAFPVFAKVQGQSTTLRRGFLQMSKLTAFAFFPALVGIAVLAPYLVPTIYGEDWSDSIRLIQLLVPVGMVKILGAPMGPILLSKGRAGTLFAWVVFVAISNAAVLMLAVDGGLEQVTAAYAGLAIMRFFLAFALVRWVAGVLYRDYFGVLTFPFFTSLVMAAIVTAAGFFVERIVGGIPLLAILAAVGALCYGVVLLKLQRPYIDEMLDLLVRRRARAKEAAAATAE